MAHLRPIIFDAGGRMQPAARCGLPHCPGRGGSGRTRRPLSPRSSPRVPLPHSSRRTCREVRDPRRLRAGAARVGRREPAGQVHGRGEQRVDELPARRRRVHRGARDLRGAAGRGAGADRDRLPARGRAVGRGPCADRRRPRGAQPGDRGEQGRHLPRRLAVRGTAPVRVRRRRAADRQRDGRRRRRHDPRSCRRHPRARQRPGWRARGQGHRSGRLRGRRDQGLREHQRHAARHRRCCWSCSC